MLSDLSGDTNRGFLRTFATHTHAVFFAVCYHSAHNLTESCCLLQDDLICLPPKVAAPLGNMGPVVFCSRVTNTVQLTDPLTLRTVPMEVRRAASQIDPRQWKPLRNVPAALYSQTLHLLPCVQGLLAPLCSTDRRTCCGSLLSEAAPAAGIVVCHLSVCCKEPAHQAW